MDRAERLYEAKQLHQEGLELSRRRRWRLSLDKFEEALKIVREIGDSKAQADILVDLGIATNRLKSHSPDTQLDTQDDPCSLYEKALKIYRSIDDSSGEASTRVEHIDIESNEQRVWQEILKNNDTNDEPLDCGAEPRPRFS